MSTCYYELLAVEQDASDAELKKAYRKMALIWHPDKNPTNLDEATQKFALIQHAYDILSDPQERSWYDSHRESILNGGNVGSEVAGDGGLSLDDIISYFSPSVYSGFGDSELGFYFVYESLFKRISFNEPSGLPEFGKSDWDYITKVKPFYDFWQDFTSVREFGWFDKYKPSDAPDRRTRRIIEKDNKKLRDAARKEYNFAVRRLAQFLCKKDPRHLKYAAELEKRNKAKKEEREASLLSTRPKKVPIIKEKANVPAWAQFTEEDLAELDQLCEEWQSNTDLAFTKEVEQDESFLEETNEDLYCVACDNYSSSPRQLAQHQSTKKHLKNVAQLRAQQLQEAFEFFSEDLDGINLEPTDNLAFTDDFSESFHNLTLEDSEFTKKSKKKNKKKNVINTFSLLEEYENIAPIEIEAGLPVRNSELGSGLPSNHIPKDTMPLVQEESNIVWSEEKLKPKKAKKTKKSNNNSLACQLCHSVFASRNQLFTHLKDSGHEKFIASSKR
ncbi:hypothetical protein DSO57_1025548 [Entomophthora muscae]|uniref:Uncharacterized protein n=1 Tax=Entomophthora muscae TaxID=34485 RepID=A0ACC2RH01_9FUNG|nr:hypothetical protein DSO57_1025548 [Entomophthora muscae]